MPRVIVLGSGFLAGDEKIDPFCRRLRIAFLPRPWLKELYSKFSHDARKRLAEKNSDVKMVTKTIVKGKVRVHLDTNKMQCCLKSSVALLVPRIRRTI